MKSLQLRPSRRGLMTMWTKNKKNSLFSGGLTRTSVVVVVVAGGATLMAVVDAEAEVAGTRTGVVVAAGTRMAVVVAAVTTMTLDTTSQGTTTTEAGVVVPVGVTTTITAGAVRVAAMGESSWMRMPSSLTVLLE